LAGKVIIGLKLKEKSGRWLTAKDAPQPKGLTLIPENTAGGKKKKIVICKSSEKFSLRSHNSYRRL
jgi:hypothetical protein